MMNQKKAKMLHEIFVEDTAFRGDTDIYGSPYVVNINDFYNNLRRGVAWGKAESYAIITALIMAGAKFEGEMDFIV